MTYYTNTITSDNMADMINAAYRLGLAVDPDTGKRYNADEFAATLAKVFSSEIVSGATVWFAMPERTIGGGYTGQFKAALFDFRKNNMLYVNGEALIDGAVNAEIRGDVEDMAYRIFKGEKVYI